MSGIVRISLFAELTAIPSIDKELDCLLSLLKGYVDAARHDFSEAFTSYSTNFSEQAALFRCMGHARAYVFINEFDQVIKLAEQLLELSPTPIMSLVRATAGAVLALVYELQANRAHTFRYAEELDILLNSEFLWPSKFNPDLLFFVQMTQCIINQMLDRLSQAHAALQRLVQVHMFTSSEHIAWLCPVIFLQLMDCQMTDIAQEVAESVTANEITSLPWLKHWNTFQQQSKLAAVLATDHDSTPSKLDAISKIDVLYQFHRGI